ncbi:MAG: hypothetical protein NTY96_04125 [Bacteroidetes bacterium]|nr:hypothetical protein [Bacteroidota bacterium]
MTNTCLRFFFPVILILFILSLIPLGLQGQYFSTGQDPASIRWKQIKTDKYKIIYPSTYEAHGQYVANIMDKVWRYETKTLSARLPRIPIIIHTESSLANGVTVWAPKRIEFYPTPDPDAYAEEWLEQLAIHEYRHALQINKMNKGFTRALYFVLGEQATGGILGAFVPTWFLEGDATVTETALTKTGRGRTSGFEGVLRAQLLENGIDNFNKATLGSYKTFTPDPYELGYYLVGMGRKDYGAKLWDYSLDHVAKYPFMIVPFADGIKRTTGLSKVKWYRKSLAELDSIWKEQDNKTPKTQGRMISRRNPKNYTTFTHPMYFNDSTVIAERQSNEDVDCFVKILSGGREKKLFQIGAYQDGSNSLSDNFIVWAEYEPDIRWGNRDYSSIKLYDMKTRKVRHLTHRSRYFAPNLSHDGSMIVAVRISTNGESFLEVLSTTDGRVLFSKKAEGSATFQSPDFTIDDKQLIYIYMNEKGKTIAICEMADQKSKYHLPFTFTGIDGPSHIMGNYIIFSSDYSGIENLYAIDTISDKVYQVTSARFGAYDPDFSSDKSRLLYSDYCNDGLMVSETGLDSSTWVPLSKVQDHSFKLYDILAGQEGVNLQDTLMNEGLYRMLLDRRKTSDSAGLSHPQYPSKKYSKAAHLFNVHSWAPVSFSISNLTLHPGIMALSQNVLSSTFASAGYDWDYNEQTGQFFLNFSYQGLFPVFDLNASYGKRAGYYITSITSPKTRFTWNEFKMKLIVSVPLNFARGTWYRGLTPAIGTSFIDVIHNKSTPELFTTGWINTITYSLNYFQYRRSNYQDMYYRWGQDLQFSLTNSPFGANDMGSIWAIQTNLYFPGLLRHHGLWLYGGYQQRNENTVFGYSYSEVIPYPRGYNNGYDNHLFSFSANYKFPLFRPDWSVGGVLYFKRFKLNLFYDQAMGDDSKIIDWCLPNLYQTIGSELTAELHILRFVYPFELGIRPMYFPTNNSWGCQFVYSVSL